MGVRHLPTTTYCVHCPARCDTICAIICMSVLEEGEITVLGSDLPIAVGDVGPLVNFEASITERDVFTVNGVIHYLNNVIVDAEEPPQPPTNEVCNQEKCLTAQN